VLVSLRPDRTAAITAAALGGLVVALLQGPHAAQPALCGVMVAAAAFGWLRSAHHSRLILDTPTSRVASAAQGYTELFGRGLPLDGTPLYSPLTGLPVLWYRLLVEERNGSDWVRQDEDESEASFLLDDGSGVCAIDPEGAEMLVNRKDVQLRGDRRLTQWCLIKHDDIYVLGDFVTLGSIDPDRDSARQVRELLAEWKADPAQLLRRFDADGDGEIDVQEWEAARAEAKQEVDRRQREIDAAPEAHLVRRPSGRRLYLISDLDPKRLARRYRIWGWIFFAAMLASLAGLAWQLAR